MPVLQQSRKPPTIHLYHSHCSCSYPLNQPTPPPPPLHHPHPCSCPLLCAVSILAPDPIWFSSHTPVSLMTQSLSISCCGCFRVLSLSVDHSLPALLSRVTVILVFMFLVLVSGLQFRWVWFSSLAWFCLILQSTVNSASVYAQM